MSATSTRCGFGLPRRHARGSSDAADFEAGSRLSEPLGLPPGAPHPAGGDLCSWRSGCSPTSWPIDEASAPVASTPAGGDRPVQPGASTEDSTRVDPGTGSPPPAQGPHTPDAAMRPGFWPRCAPFQWTGAALPGLTFPPPTPSSETSILSPDGSHMTCRWAGASRSGRTQLPPGSLRAEVPRHPVCAAHRARAEGTRPEASRSAEDRPAAPGPASDGPLAPPSRSCASPRRRPRTATFRSSSRDVTTPGLIGLVLQRVAISWRWSLDLGPRGGPPNGL